MKPIELRENPAERFTITGKMLLEAEHLVEERRSLPEKLLEAIASRFPLGHNRSMRAVVAKVEDRS